MSAGTQTFGNGTMPAGSGDPAATSASMDQPGGNRGPAVLAVSLWMIAFSTVFVVLRCVSRLGILKRWAWDDTFIVIAWFLAFGFTFSICWGVRAGLGLHEVDVAPENELALRKSEFAFSVLYNPVLMATKTSILCFYLTLARNQALFRYATWATLVVVNVAGFGLTMLNVFQCHPISTLFLPTIPSYAVCIDLVVIYLSSSPVNIVTDLAILVLPFPALTNMRLPKKQKIILVITFSFGAFVAVVDVVRIAYLQQAFEQRLREVGQQNSATSKALEQDDFSWYASLSFMWSAIEVHIGIICACVPSLKPLVARILPSMLRDMANPKDTSFVPQDSRMPVLNFLSAPGDVMKAGDMSAIGNMSPPASPADVHFKDVSGFASLDAEAAPERSSPPGSWNEKAKANGEAAEPSDRHAHEAGHGNRLRISTEEANAAGRAEPREMGLMEFLTTPDMASPPQTEPPLTARTTGTTATASTGATSARRGSVPYFDFYNMQSKKPMTQLSNQQAFAPLAAVTMLFFLWGFAYGLLDVLNQKFASVNGLSSGQSLGLHAAYFGAYAFGPLTVGQTILMKLGFRATFIAGLAIYAVGTLIFWPAAVLSSYPAYVVCNFINGFGVSILEVAANPFITLCGPARHAEVRLNISQGVQAIGTILAPLLATKVLFVSVTDGSGLIDVQWTYLGIAFFDVALAVIFFYMPLPEATDDDFERVAEKRESINSAQIGGFRVIYVTLGMAVFSNFCYLGAQESASEAYQTYIAAIAPKSSMDPFNWQTVGHTVFAVGRFVTAALQFLMRPRTVLLLLYVGMIVTAALCMVVTGSAGIAMLTLYETFQSGVFSLIFAIAMRGLGSFTKRGAVLLTMSTSGGAIFPVIMSPIATSFSVPYSFCVVVACSAFGAVFPLYMAVTPQARAQVDPVLAVKRQTLPFDEDEARGPRRRMSWIQKWPRRPEHAPAIEHVENDEKAMANGAA